MGDCSKCKAKKKEDFIGCDGPCRRWWHYSCVRLTETEYRFLSKNNNVVYICDSCRPKYGVLDNQLQQDTLQNILQKVSENHTDTKGYIDEKISVAFNRMEELLRTFRAEIFERVSSTVSTGIPNINNATTYSKVLQTKPTVIIKPKDPKQTSNTTKSEVLKNIDPIKEDLVLEQVRNISNGGVAVRCESNDKFSELLTLKMNNSYDIKVVNPANPRIRISGLSDKLDDDTLLKMLKLQNKCIFDTDHFIKLISVHPLRKNGNLFQATFEVDPNTYQRLFEQAHVLIGYDYCKVYDATEIKRCFKCSGFHHYANKCDAEAPTCPKCAENHVLSECKSSFLKCIHCSNYNSRGPTHKVKTNHAVWDKSCFTYKLALDNFKHNILNIK